MEPKCLLALERSMASAQAPKIMQEPLGQHSPSFYNTKLANKASIELHYASLLGADYLQVISRWGGGQERTQTKSSYCR
jgi:hypothetical protein